MARAELDAGPAFGRGALERQGTRKDVAAVMQTVQRERADRVVVGLPLRTDGTDSPQTTRVRAFAAALAAAGLRVDLEDERFTTRLALQRLHGARPGKRRAKGSIDEASAVLILESYVARHRRARARAADPGRGEPSEER